MVSATAIGKKRQVLRNSRPCYQDCWHTCLVGWRRWPLWCRPSSRRGSYASFIRLPLAGSRRHKGDELPYNGPYCLCGSLLLMV